MCVIQESVPRELSSLSTLLLKPTPLSSGDPSFETLLGVSLVLCRGLFFPFYIKFIYSRDSLFSFPVARTSHLPWCHRSPGTRAFGYRLRSSRCVPGCGVGRRWTVVPKDKGLPGAEEPHCAGGSGRVSLYVRVPGLEGLNLSTGPS